MVRSILLCACVAGTALCAPGGAAAEPALKVLVIRHAAEHGVPAALADALVRAESNYRPNARSGGNLGLTQISHATARRLGYRGTAEGLFDPEINLRWGLLYFGRAYALAGGETCGTILRFNRGLDRRVMTPRAAAYCAKIKRLIAAR